MSATESETGVVPVGDDDPESRNKIAAFVRDFGSDPAIAFVLVSDPLIFMLPEHLDMEAMPHADEMHNIVATQAVAATVSRLAASWVHVNHPDFAHSRFMDHLPLRISGYTHLGMGIFLAAVGQVRESAIAIPLGLGNLRLTGDLGAVEKAVKRALPGGGENGQPKNGGVVPTLVSAYKDANANFAIAQFAILTTPLAALGQALGSGKLNTDVLAQAAPAVPLAVATYFIGRNVVNNERANRNGPPMLTYHNAGYPTMLIGTTAGVGGLAGLYSLHLKGSLGTAFNDVGGALENAAHHYAGVIRELGADVTDLVTGSDAEAMTATVAQPSAPPNTIQDPGDAYVAGISIASITIALAYAVLERKFGTFFKPGRPKKVSVPNPANDSPSPG